MDRMMSHAIETALAAMARKYGAQFAAMWSTTKPEDLTQAMAEELGGFRHNLDAIAWATRHLPERCPNVIQFRNLCHQAPSEHAPMERSKEPTRAPTPAEVATIKALAKSIREGSMFAKPGRDWAAAILARDPATCTVAQVAMAMSIKERHHGHDSLA